MKDKYDTSKDIGTDISLEYDVTFSQMSAKKGIK